MVIEKWQAILTTFGGAVRLGRWRISSQSARHNSTKVGKPVKDGKVVEIDSVSNLMSAIGVGKSDPKIPDFDVLKKYSYWDWQEIPVDKAPAAVPLESYRVLNANDLQSEVEPVRCSKMLCRDFIHDSLYNPHYGYFSKNVSIFQTEGGKGLDFGAIKDEYEFNNVIAELYVQADSKFRAKRALANDKSPWRQAWHTPTELFAPWYGYAVAECIVQRHRQDLVNGTVRPLLVYEVGAGNGTLMLNILDYIRERYPDIYRTAQYRVVEISSKLAEEQSLNLNIRLASQRHSCIRIVNQSILEWTEQVDDPCFVLAFEVVDNFAHDCIVSTGAGEILQQCILLDEYGNYSEAYEPVRDPLLAKFVNLREQGVYARFDRCDMTTLQRIVRPFWPFLFDLSPREYVPTELLQFLNVLGKRFPNHHLLLTDFHQLPDSMDPIALMAPVVQTRFEDKTVPCSTLLVSPGWFDIFFPTNFQRLQKLYRFVNPKKAETQILSHEEFLKRYASTEKTRLQSGENPMLSFYKNVSFFIA